MSHGLFLLCDVTRFIFCGCRVVYDTTREILEIVVRDVTQKSKIYLESQFVL